MFKKKTGNTKIYVVFSSPGIPVGFKLYRKYHPDIKVPKNSEILERIKDECKGIEFIGETEPVKAEKIVSDIKDQKEDLDGILYFGAPPDELISIGLPMVAVERPLEACSTMPFHAYKESRVVTSYLPAHYDKDPKVYSSRIKDIAGKIKLIDAIARMKDLRVLVVTDKPILGYTEPKDFQFETTREEYEKTYLDNLKETFGTEFITVSQKELLEKMQAADEEKAEEIAHKWIKEAIMLRGTNEREVLREAKVYLAMKELMDEYDCGAITIEGFNWAPYGYDANLPCACLAISQLLTEGIAAAGETLTDCLILQQLGLYITGSGGLLGDYNIDPFNNTAIVCHCEGTLKPYGDERRAPYIIRNIQFMKENTGGACVQTSYPIGETVTVVRISMYKKKISIFTGETVSGEEFYPYWDDILGRNKVIIKTNAQKLLENVDWKTFGNHRVVFFGDYRQEFKDLAKLIGFEVVEEDR